MPPCFPARVILNTLFCPPQLCRASYGTGHHDPRCVPDSRSLKRTCASRTFWCGIVDVPCKPCARENSISPNRTFTNQDSIPPTRHQSRCECNSCLSCGDTQAGSVDPGSPLKAMSTWLTYCSCQNPCLAALLSSPDY